MKQRSLRWLGSLLVFAIFCGAAWLLYRQLQKYNPQAILDSLRQVPLSLILLAIVITHLNYGVLVVYDYLAFRFAGVPISWVRVTFASFISYAFSYNFGATLAGIPLRYRIYSSWGIPIAKIVQLLVILALTFWFGVFALAGTLFVIPVLRIPPDAMQHICDAMADKNIHAGAIAWFRYLFADSRPFGVALLTMAAAYVGTSACHSGEIKIFRWKLPVPPLRLTLYQIGIASADMLVAGCVLYVIFPPVQGGYLTVLAVYLVAYVIVVLSHVPGGWGVLEAMILLLLTNLQLVGIDEEPKVVAALLIFRVIYFLVPLLLGATLCGLHEYALRKKWIPPLVVPADGSADDAAQPEAANAPAGQNGKAALERRLPAEKK
jgi:uncharacterized membrane protein YbhN (UPF0104 family)